MIRFKIQNFDLFNLFRVHGGKTLSGPGNSVKLVHSDGCRDPNYKVLYLYTVDIIAKNSTA